MNKHLPISNDIKRIIGRYTLPLKFKPTMPKHEFGAIKMYLDSNTIRYEIGGYLYKCPNFNIAKYKHEKSTYLWVLRPKSDTVLELYF
jgi:hypothetical protein